MRKFTFLVTRQESEAFISAIRRLGVVHVDELQAGATSPSFEAAKSLDARYATALRRLDEVRQAANGDKGAPSATPAPLPKDEAEIARAGAEALAEVERLDAEAARLAQALEAARKDRERLLPWGDFDRLRLATLEAAGLSPRFYVCAEGAYQTQWEKDCYAAVISRANKKVYFVTFAPDAQVNAEVVDLPDSSLSDCQRRISTIEAQLQETNDKLLALNAEKRELLEAAQTANGNEISLARVRLSGEPLAEDAVRLFRGWVPAESRDAVVTYLEENHVFYEDERPTLDDDVPVEIRNGSYSSLFEPILRMYALPRYSDLDVTPFLAPFFMLFFGLCMGDAGYGAIILVLSIVAKAKLKPSQKPLAKLGIYLGAMTIVCGSLTGSLFGIDLTQTGWAFLAPVKDLFINENNFKIFGYSPMMVIAVVLGFIQVIVGMVLCAVKAARNYGWIFAVGKLSWVVLLLAAIVCFGLPACGLALPQALVYALYGVMGVCLVGIFFLNTPHKNPLINFGTGVWDTYGMATGLLGDLLSYIRLFALGLTGGVLGSVFNTLAIDMTGSLPWAIRWLPMLLILLVGHGINFALCIISSVVHPIRLTFVEFFKNANFEGGGRAYEPFRVKRYEREE